MYGIKSHLVETQGIDKVKNYRADEGLVVGNPPLTKNYGASDIGSRAFKRIPHWPVAEERASR